MSTNKKYAPQARYDAKYRKDYTLSCITRTEQDIIAKLDSVPNRSGYIKRLIRADIAASEEE